MKHKATNFTGLFKEWLGRIIVLALILFLLYLIFGDEDHAVRNTIRAAIRGILRAL